MNNSKDSNTKESIHKELELLDKSFVNSILSYGVYSDRQWTLGDYDSNGTQTDKIENFLKESGLEDKNNINLKKAYEVFLTLFNRETFEKVDLKLASNGSSRYDNKEKEFSFEYEPGHYEALDNLAKAGIYKSKNPDGTYNLHLSFRGTDTNARNFLAFATDAYSDMARYYEVFKPLEKAVLEYAKDPNNKISSLQVSGHSLGGAMVQAFFNSDEVKKSSIPMEGFTYGAPGAKKNIFYKLLPDFIDLTNSLGFVSLGVKAYNLLQEEKKNVIDPRITQFTHKGDLVPKLGSVLYDTQGEQYGLDDTANKNFQTNGVLNKKQVNENVSFNRERGRFTVFTKMVKNHEESFFGKIKTYLENRFAFKHHDMLRYSFNIENEAVRKGVEFNKLNTADNVIESTPNINFFSQFRSRFIQQIHKTNQDDPITLHFFNSQKTKINQDGNVVHRLPKDVGEIILEMRKNAFASNIQKLALKGI